MILDRMARSGPPATRAWCSGASSRRWSHTWSSAMRHARLSQSASRPSRRISAARPGTAGEYGGKHAEVWVLQILSVLYSLHPSPHSGCLDEDEMFHPIGESWPFFPCATLTCTSKGVVAATQDCPDPPHPGCVSEPLLLDQCCPHWRCDQP